MLDKAFGGGMLAMSDAAWDLLYKVCRIDHMGAAEYELGVLPAAFNRLLQYPDLVGFSFVIGRKDVPLNWKRESEAREQRRKELTEAKAAGAKPKRAKKVIPTDITDKKVFVLCSNSIRAEVPGRILDVAKRKVDTKRDHCFDLALDPWTNRQNEIVGWFELNNYFLFFTDVDMWTAFCEMFGAKME